MTNSKQYWTEPSGEALETAHAHTKDAELTLFGACFCPFVQRVWIALEALGDLPYRYYEIDPYNKSSELLEVSPRGLVPALRLDGDRPRAISESTVIIEYLEDLAESKGSRQLLPSRSDPCASLTHSSEQSPPPYFVLCFQDARAKARFFADQINRNIVPNFYRYLQAQETEKQIQGAKEFIKGIDTLCKMFRESVEEGLTEVVGLWREGGQVGWADVMMAPWLIRSENVLKHYRGFQTPTAIEGYEAWLKRLIADPAIRRTTSTDILYLDSYARYAENRPNTSQVAAAINEGRGLP